MNIVGLTCLFFFDSSHQNVWFLIALTMGTSTNSKFEMLEKNMPVFVIGKKLVAKVWDSFHCAHVIDHVKLSIMPFKFCKT